MRQILRALLCAMLSLPVVSVSETNAVRAGEDPGTPAPAQELSLQVCVLNHWTKADELRKGGVEGGHQPRRLGESPVAESVKRINEQMKTSLRAEDFVFCKEEEFLYTGNGDATALLCFRTNDKKEPVMEGGVIRIGKRGGVLSRMAPPLEAGKSAREQLPLALQMLSVALPPALHNEPAWKDLVQGKAVRTHRLVFYLKKDGIGLLCCAEDAEALQVPLFYLESPVKIGMSDLGLLLREAVPVLDGLTGEEKNAGS